MTIGAAATADAWSRRYYCEDIWRPFFVADPDRPGWLRSDRPGAFASSFPAVKARGTFRVFVLGGSIAKLLHEEQGPGDLGAALQEALPSLSVETLNCGMMGYDTFREALLEAEVLEYAPDLLVFLTGHYEGIDAVPVPIWVDDARARRKAIAAYRARLKTLGAAPGTRGGDSDAIADARDAAFARNLAENVRRARARGVEAAVVVPPRNYREPAEVGRTLHDARFLPGWLRFLRGDHRGARRLWRESLAGARGGDEKAFTWGFIARCEERLGLWAQARKSFERTARFDRTAMCGAAGQEAIRSVVKREGGIVVEADRMFRALAHPRMPGLETFNERKNWKPRLNRLVNLEIVSALRQSPRLRSLPWDRARIRKLKACAPKPGGPGTAEDGFLIMSYALVELSKPDFSRLSTLSVFYLDALLSERPGWFRDLPALVEQTRARRRQTHGDPLAPDAVLLARLHWHLGEVRLLRKERARAIKDFSRSLELDPKQPWALWSLALAQFLSGRRTLGERRLREAVRLAAGHPRRDDILAAAEVLSRPAPRAGRSGSSPRRPA
ncbi:MAG: hypothetical protein HY077_06215 [Elusimicrobia bacterium]|nr:hypothetical protein [Elusimicrobiota bacterium]